jgi:hypothetical protein
MFYVKPKRPVKPRKASAIRLAAMKEIGYPLSVGLIGAKSNRSRIAAKMMITSVNPNPVPIAKTVPFRRLNLLSMFRNVTPRIAQFVVIKGRYMPRALYNARYVFFRNISTSCTSDAMVSMKTAVRRKTRFNGKRITLKTIHVIQAARVMTNITAMPIPVAVSTVLDTPKNGHRPKKRIKTILLTKNAARNIRAGLFI